jgi:Fe-S cluster assembly protein SufD
MTVEQVTTTGPYEDAFRQLLAKSSAAEPSWLTRQREKAFGYFQRFGFPTVREEDWKYTNVSPITRAKFNPLFHSTVAADLNGSAEAFIYDETRGSRLVFLNGVFQRKLSSVADLQSNLIAGDFAETLKQPADAERIREYFTKNSEYNGFTALNEALFSSGAFLVIPRGAEIKTPIHLLFISQAQNGEAPTSFPRVLIIAEANSAATIVEGYAGVGGGNYFTNAVVDLNIGPGARLEHYKIQRENLSAFHVATSSASLGKNSRYDTTAINLGASLSRHNIDVRFDDEGGECAVDGLYMLDTNQHSDTHSLIDHRYPHCTSHQLYKGVLDGKSHAVFNGKVFVRHGAQQTDAQQTNKNLLLSNEARVDTKPQLEIFADDVKCAHGAAVGQLSEEELFYLESRGINPVLARNMLTYGFAEEVIEKIKIDSIRRELDGVVLNRLHSNLEIG